MSNLHIEISAQISVAARLFVPPFVTTFKPHRTCRLPIPCRITTARPTLCRKRSVQHTGTTDWGHPLEPRRIERLRVVPL
jgi:hypothetical protein